MSIQIGYIENITGDATVTLANGTTADLTQNSALSENDIITTGANATVIVKLSDGSSITVGPNQTVTLDKTVHDSEELAQDETQAEVDSLKEILAENPDLSVFEETASGEAVAIGGSSLIIDSIEKHNDNSGESGSSTLDQFASNKHNNGIDDDDTFGLVTDATPASVTLSNVLTNDNTPTITGTISDPTADIVISVGGNDYTAINNGDGTWTLPETDPLPDGTTEIVVVATDPAGNETTETAEITVDTVDPIVTIDPVNTNDTTPVITGTTDDDTATIVVTIGGEEQTATNNGDGTWSLPITDPLPEGDTVITVVATDPAGNSTTETETIVIDTIDPTVTIDPTNTNDTTPVITGTTDDNTATIIVTIGGVDQTATNNGDGTWSLPITDPLPEGDTVVTVVATDPAGNSTTDTETIVVDTIDPIITIDPVNTNDTTPVLTGTTDDNTATIIVTIGGVEQTATNNGDGTWSLPITDPLAEGDTVVTVVATDPAGNTTTETETVVIDTIAPTVTVDTTPTNDATPTISGTISENDATIVVTIGGTDYDAVNNGDGTWTLPVTDTLPEGDNEIIVVATDPAGNETTETVTLAVDTIAPIVKIDEIHTNYDRPEFTGTIDDNSAAIVVTVNGTDYDAINNGDGTWTLPQDTVAVLAENVDIVITVTATDPVGNETVVTDTFVVDTILDDVDNDNGSNVVTIDSITEDTGASDTDFITNDTTLLIRGTYDNEVDNALTVVIDGVEQSVVITDKSWVVDYQGTTLADGTHTIEAIVTDDAGNTKSVTQTITIDTSGTGDDGNGNGIDGADATVTLDEISDNYINLDETLSGITVTGETTLLNGGEVVVEFNGQTYTATATGGDISGTPNTFSLTIPTEDLVGVNDGTYIVTASVVADKAGNVVSDTEDVTIDTSNSDNNGNGNTDSGADATITLHEISDNYINLAETGENLLITGTSTAKEGSSVTIEITGGDGVAHNINEFLDPDPVIEVDASGNFNVTFIATAFTSFPDGDYTVTATVIADNAGNTISDIQNVTLDTTLGNGDINGDVVTIEALYHDRSDADIEANAITTFETDDKSVVITGTVTIEADSRLIVIITNDSTGVSVEYTPEIAGDIWTLDLETIPFSADTYTITAKVTDTAGNNIEVSDGFTITPATGVLAIESITEDTGLSGADFITQDTTLMISGSMESATNNTLVITIGGDTYTVADPELTVNADDTWTLDLTGSPLDSDADYTLTVKETGPGVDTTVSQTITTDNTGPSDDNNSNGGNVVTIDSITDDTGVSNSDFITNDTNILIKGTFDNEDGNQLTVTINGSLYDVTIDAADQNLWSIDLTGTTLSEGDYTVIATVSDVAGNTVSETQVITIDTTVNPIDGDATILLNEISGNVINADEASSSTLTVISGTTTATENQVVTIKVNGVEFDTTLVAADGTFSVSIPQNTFAGYVDGTYTVTAEVMADAAGNIVSDNQNVILDTTLGTIQNVIDSGVKESALETGTNPSVTGRTSEGNLLANDTLDADAVISGVSANGVDAIVWSENADILVLDTPSGIIYVATADTTQNGVDYTAGDYYYELQDSSTSTQEVITYTVSDTVGNSATADLTIAIEDDIAIGQTVDKYLVDKEQGVTTNLTLTIDTSGSMNEIINVTNEYQDFIFSFPFFGDSTKDVTVEGNPGDSVFFTQNGESELLGTVDETGTFSTTVDFDTFFFFTFGSYTIEVGETRLDLTKDAVNNLIDAYAIKGDVNVRLITFDDESTVYTWRDSTELDDIKAIINGLVAEGGTDYDDAIADVMDYYSTQETPPVATDDVMYFLSDGIPTGSDNGYDNWLDLNQQSIWNDYIDTTGLDVHAVGVGTATTDTDEIYQLNTVSNPRDENGERVEGENDPILVSDENELYQALLDTMTDGHIVGNILLTDDYSSPIILGADGGTITQLQMLDVNGDPIPGAVVTSADADVDGNVTMTTPLGATVTVNFITGAYDYQLDVTDANFGLSETVEVTALTSDAQEVTGIFTLHIDTPNSDGDDTILYDTTATFNDGGLGFDTLILNASDDLDFSAVSNIQNIEAIDLVGGDHNISNLTVQDVVDMTDVNNELFIYGDAGDNVALEPTLIDQNTTVTDSDGKVFDVFSDAGNTVTVNIEQEIIVS